MYKSAKFHWTCPTPSLGLSQWGRIHLIFKLQADIQRHDQKQSWRKTQKMEFQIFHFFHVLNKCWIFSGHGCCLLTTSTCWKMTKTWQVGNCDFLEGVEERHSPELALMLLVFLLTPPYLTYPKLSWCQLHIRCRFELWLLNRSSSEQLVFLRHSTFQAWCFFIKHRRCWKFSLVVLVDLDYYDFNVAYANSQLDVTCSLLSRLLGFYLSGLENKKGSFQ